MRVVNGVEIKDANSYKGYTGIGRSASYVIAASDAPAIWKAQADVVCDGTADNVEIQAANDALTSGGKIILSPGSFNIISNLELSSNITFEGQGSSTILVRSSSDVTTVFVNDNIAGSGYAGNSNITIRNLKIDGNADTYATNHLGIGLAHTTNCLIENVEIVDLIGWHGVEINSSQYVTVRNCYIHNDALNGNSLANEGLQIDAAGEGQFDIVGMKDDDTVCQYITFKDNTIINYRVGIGSHSSSTGHHLYILNNTIRGFDSYGISVYGWTYTDVKGNKISDGDNTATGEIGILISATSTDVLVSGNTIYNLRGNTNARGISIADNSSCVRINIENNTVSNIGKYGIAVGLAADDCKVINNTVLTSGADVAGGYGIYLYQCTNTICSSNHIDNTTVDPGIISNGTTNCSIVLNSIVSDPNQMVVKSGTNTNLVVKDNIGYIDKGEIRTASGSLVPTGTCTATTATGVFTESPLSLKPGANTMTCTTSGTINVVMPAGSTAVVTSGDSTVTDSPKTCPASATTVVTVTAGAGAKTFTITVHHNVFAWHDPEAQDILVKKVVINRTAAGGTATAEINVGIADNGTVDDPGTEFFENLLANNAAALHDSYVAGGTSYGTQTIWVTCQDSASATGGWVVGKLDTEIANSLAGTWYVEYVGK